MALPTVGTVIAGRYTLERHLDEGGMAAVWVAHDAKLCRAVAVKMIAPELVLSKRQKSLRRFEREAKAVARLRSPHIIEVYDYGVDGGIPFIIMELLEGCDLGYRLERKGRLPIETVARIVGQIAKALDTAHAAGVVHRDLKPQNVFLVRARSEEIVKVLDFGIAKAPRGLVAGDPTTKDELIGTPRYMSPEQLLCEGKVDYRSDLWSLGVVAYRALCGSTPFDAESVMALVTKIAVRPHTPPSELVADLGVDVDAFFDRALAKAPPERFQSAHALAAELARLADVSYTSGDIPPLSSSRLPLEDLQRLVDSGGRPPADDRELPTVVDRPGPSHAASGTDHSLEGSTTIRTPTRHWLYDGWWLLLLAAALLAGAGGYALSRRSVPVAGSTNETAEASAGRATALPPATRQTGGQGPAASRSAALATAGPATLPTVPAGRPAAPTRAPPPATGAAPTAAAGGADLFGRPW